LSATAAAAIANAGTYNGQQLHGKSVSNGFNGQNVHLKAKSTHTTVQNSAQHQVGQKQYGAVQNNVNYQEETLAPSSQSGYSNSQSWAERHQGKKVAW